MSVKVLHIFLGRALGNEHGEHTIDKALCFFTKAPRPDVKLPELSKPTPRTNPIRRRSCGGKMPSVNMEIFKKKKTNLLVLSDLTLRIGFK